MQFTLQAAGESRYHVMQASTNQEMWSTECKLTENTKTVARIQKNRGEAQHGWSVTNRDPDPERPRLAEDMFTEVAITLLP